MDLAERIMARLALLRQTPRVICIDGRSGSGKSTLAAALARLECGRTWSRPTILPLEDLYPGWGGLAAGAAAVPAVLHTGRLRRYDWVRERFLPEETLRDGPIIVEGCGSVTPDTLAAAHRRGPVWSIWLEAPAPDRYARAMTRDGDVFAPHWGEWAAQEEAHFTQVRPRELVNELVHIRSDQVKPLHW